MNQCETHAQQLQNEFESLEFEIDKCNDKKSHKPDYEKNIIKFNKRITELRAENSVRSTASEYFLGTLIFVGFVMFLYAVYISLYSPSIR
jgi:hypothetical protein